MEDRNGNIIANKTAPQLADIASKESDPTSRQEEFTYGWGKIRPKCLQFFNRPAVLLIVFCVYNTFQGVAAWGMTSLVLPSIERRFSFTAKELGVISTSNDVTAVLFVVFVSYYGDYGNKIKWMAGGAMTTGIGVFLFGIPHFMIGRHDPGHTHSGSLCDYGNTTSTQCSANSGGEWYYLAVFILAMLIMGAGSAPYFSLFNAYLDENVEPKSFPLYLGIFTTIQFIAPGIGFVIGGKFLSIYVDIKQPDGFNLTPSNPRWIGAWWLGFLIFGLLIVLCSLVMFGFPRTMPGARERRQKHVQKGHIKASTNAQEPSLKKIPFELKELLRNSTYFFNVLGMTCLLFYVGALLPFYPKILRMKFGVSGVQAGYTVAVTSVSGTLLGTITGSIIVRMFSLKMACKKAAAACVLAHLLACGGALIFLIPSCTNTNLAGVSIEYNSPMNGTELGELKSPCNIRCRCSLKSFSPVCGSNNVTYLDACHAGCTSLLPDKTFANCSCIQTANQSGSARPGYCDRDCKNLVTFIIISVITSAIRFSSVVPTRTVLLRCVPDNKRAFASGISYVTTKTFGLLPAPLIFGHIFDESCRLWQNICGRQGRCFDYDITSLSRNVAFLGLFASVLTTLFYFLSWYFCKPPRNKDVVCIENKDAEKAEETTL